MDWVQGVVLFCGKKRSGKNEAAKVFAEVCKAAGVDTMEFAFADKLRAHLSTLDPIVGGESVQYGVDWVRWNKAIEQNGYEKAKALYPEMRRLMQSYGTEVIRAEFGDDFWAMDTTRRVRSFWDTTHSLHTKGKVALITDTRFESEFNEFAYTCGHPVIGVYSERPALSLDSHKSEDFSWLIDEKGYAKRSGVVSIYNEKTLDHFREKVRRLAVQCVSELFRPGVNPDKLANLKG